MNVLFDTNILIDYLNGVPKAKEEMHRHEDPAISLITWMETLVGVKEVTEENIIRSFLQRFEILSISQDIAEIAIEKRRRHRLRLPDAIIWATAEVHSMVLITRNTRDFPRELAGVHVPYEL